VKTGSAGVFAAQCR